jgi:probable F420-dependent oxidoreductase
MRFSIPLSPYDRFKDVHEIVGIAQHAERLGFFGLAFPEHIIMPQKGEALPHRATWYDNFVLASYVAAHTRRLRLLFTVMVVPYRPPIQTAKMLATLDVVSGGRLICGTGTGWLRGEFAALGIPFEERGALTDEYLRVMRTLWTQDSPSFEGRYIRFFRIAFEPKCIQKPHVPIWVGGSGSRVLRRVVELGNGWIPMSGTIEEIGHDIALTKIALREAGRDPDDMDFSYSIIVGERDQQSEKDRAHPTGGRTTVRPEHRTAEDVISGIQALQATGLNHLLLSFSWRNGEDLHQHMDRFAREVLPSFSSETG